ncbi:glucosyltransferase domain-containing protein [Enterobacter hormaechei]|uniref:glucosyltransferase domain-containing protein n=1 Tax=Enterobacter hormaechei TaxID=158836 RepID=UPI000795D4E9|nr:glucosyltransferase domain-containing protein [Enterobacter hormaechei]EMA8094506.1 glucosyltransferase domain-containing protein [Enterobacter hormaechei]EMA8106435.1 glucosyltransferase domain-containing protein [Enterobacter hormaechei]CZX51662.1 Uncharacterised protein [Enterobacter hormaechei]HCT2132375.1 glucosyltransferase domain-containing protein [Enterobacter hormaechei]
MFVEYKKYSLCSFSIIAPFMAIIFAVGKLYLDDNARVMDGYYGWENEGRPLASLVIYILNFGRILTDISPLSQLIAIALAVGSCSIIGRDVLKKSPVVSAIATSPLFIFPFFIQNLSFRFDSVTMCLSIFILCIPFIAFSGRSAASSALITFLSVQSSLLTYQASLPVFYAILMTCFTYDKDKDARKYILILASSAFSLLLYIAVTSKSFVTSGYASGVGGILMPSHPHFKEIIESTYRVAVYPFGVLFDKHFAIAISFMSILFLFSIITRINITRKSNIVVFSLITIALACSILMFYVLENPSINLRMMIWASAIVFIVFSVGALNSNKYAYIILSIPPIVLMFSYANDYYNSQKSQYELETMLVREIGGNREINKLNTPIYLNGYSGLSPQAKRIIEKRPLIQDMMRHDIGTWTSAKFAYLHYPMAEWKWVGKLKDKTWCDHMITPWNGYYSSHWYKDGVMVTFEKCRT